MTVSDCYFVTEILGAFESNVISVIGNLEKEFNQEGRSRLAD